MFWNEKASEEVWSICGMGDVAFLDLSFFDLCCFLAISLLALLKFSWSKDGGDCSTGGGFWCVTEDVFATGVGVTIECVVAPWVRRGARANRSIVINESQIESDIGGFGRSAQPKWCLFEESLTQLVLKE